MHTKKSVHYFPIRLQRRIKMISIALYIYESERARKTVSFFLDTQKSQIHPNILALSLYWNFLLIHKNLPLLYLIISSYIVHAKVRENTQKVWFVKRPRTELQLLCDNVCTTHFMFLSLSSPVLWHEKIDKQVIYVTWKRTL